jgi:hypothetical protein
MKNIGWFNCQDTCSYKDLKGMPFPCDVPYSLYIRGYCNILWYCAILSNSVIKRLLLLNFHDEVVVAEDQWVAEKGNGKIYVLEQVPTCNNNCSEECAFAE